MSYSQAPVALPSSTGPVGATTTAGTGVSAAAAAAAAASTSTPPSAPSATQPSMDRAGAPQFKFGDIGSLWDAATRNQQASASATGPSNAFATAGNNAVPTRVPPPPPDSAFGDNAQTAHQRPTRNSAARSALELAEFAELIRAINPQSAFGRIGLLHSFPEDAVTDIAYLQSLMDAAASAGVHPTERAIACVPHPSLTAHLGPPQQFFQMEEGGDSKRHDRERKLFQSFAVIPKSIIPMEVPRSPQGHPSEGGLRVNAALVAIEAFLRHLQARLLTSFRLHMVHAEQFEKFLAQLDFDTSRDPAAMAMRNATRELQQYDKDTMADVQRERIACCGLQPQVHRDEARGAAIATSLAPRASPHMDVLPDSTMEELRKEVKRGRKQRTSNNNTATGSSRSRSNSPRSRTPSRSPTPQSRQQRGRQRPQQQSNNNYFRNNSNNNNRNVSFGGSSGNNSTNNANNGAGGGSSGGGSNFNNNNNSNNNSYNSSGGTARAGFRQQGGGAGRRQ